MDYFFEAFLDRLPVAVRSRLWDFVVFFMEDDEELVLPERAAADTPASRSPVFSWVGMTSGSRKVPKPKEITSLCHSNDVGSG